MAQQVAVSLFRGINVGGHRTVRMNELRDVYEALGLSEVVSYIQSGNLVFSHEDMDLAALASLIEESFASRFGFHAHVLLRSAAELAGVIARHPLHEWSGKEPKQLMVVFLAAPANEEALAQFQRVYSGPEELHASGKELYIYYPNGVGRSKLSHNVLEKRLKTVGTARNWSTVLELQKLVQEAARTFQDGTRATTTGTSAV